MVDMSFMFIPIQGYPNYMICKEGLIVNRHAKFIYGKKETILKKDGTYLQYRRILLYKNKKPKHFYLHRLLAIHFIPNPENKPCVDHINGNGLNNNLNNLRWATYSENSKNRISKGYWITKIKRGKKKWVVKYRIDINNKNKIKSKHFKTEEEAQEYANSRTFPLQRDHHGIFYD